MERNRVGEDVIDIDHHNHVKWHSNLFIDIWHLPLHAGFNLEEQLYVPEGYIID